MTNNFDSIKNYMREAGIPEYEKYMGDLFFVVMMVRRGKDHPNMPAANYTFKTYYIDSIEKLNKCEDEIIKCCEMFGLRAYVSVNIKSKEDFSKYCSMKYAMNALNNEYKKPWRVIDHVFGKLPGKNDDRWILDVDDINENKGDWDRVHMLTSIIRKCESRYEDPVIIYIDTRSGVHIITHPFNLQKFNMYCDEANIEKPEVKKNHITLLYENI